jgi:hypothetical protein
MNFDSVVVLVLSLFVLWLAIKFEREDMGCANYLSTSVDACSDRRSVYVRNSLYSQGDDAPSIKKKLKRLLNYENSAGSWKRCVLWSFMLAILNYAIYEKGGSINETNINGKWLFVISWIVSFTVLYGMKSFESFHILQVIHRTGCHLLSKL